MTLLSIFVLSCLLFFPTSHSRLKNIHTLLPLDDFHTRHIVRAFAIPSASRFYLCIEFFHFITSIMATPLPDLPDPVLSRILDFLLLAEHCEITRQSTKTKLCRAYDFQLNILRTCRRLYDGGCAVFKLNNFIVASTTAPPYHIVTEAQDHNVIIWTKKLNAFKNYKARLHLLSGKLKGDSTHFFMMCSADLEDFVCILRYLTFTDMRPTFNIHLKLGAPGSNSLALKDQEAILSPFEKLVGEGQRCKITGIVDNALAKRVVANATPTIFWSRAQCRDFLNIVEHDMRIADVAASNRHFDVTHHIYHKIQRCMEAPGKIGKVMSQFIMCEDEALNLSFSIMQSRHQHGYAGQFVEVNGATDI